MHIVMFLLFGLVVGAIARFLVPGADRGGWVLSIVIGVVGSMVGGFLGQALGLYREGQSAGFLMSLVGAIAVVVVYHGLAGRRSRA